MFLLSIILSILAGWLSAAVLFTVIREHGRLIACLIAKGEYSWTTNGVNTAAAMIAVVLWVIVAHLN